MMRLVTHKTSGTPLSHHIVAQDTTVGAQVGADRARDEVSWSHPSRHGPLIIARGPRR